MAIIDPRHAAKQLIYERIFRAATLSAAILVLLILGGVAISLLSGAWPDRIEVHHLLDHDTASIQALIASFDVPYDVHVHDYGWFCPRLSLLGAHDRYCGEPDLPDCEDCVADLGHFLHEDISVAALRDRSATFLANARAVVVPSADTGTRMRRHFAGLTPAVVPHENDAAIQVPMRRRHMRGRRNHERDQA